MLGSSVPPCKQPLTGLLRKRLRFHQSLAPCKEIQDSLGFWILRAGFRILITGFHYSQERMIILSCYSSIEIPIVSGIPDFLSCIPNSNTYADSGFRKKIYPDSGFHKQNIPAFWHLDSTREHVGDNIMFA